jgi:ubiquinone/menaquinone biosynthesis C-methylase UbiE
MVEAAQIQPGQRVLDVACGTGILAREVAARVGADGSVVGLDANPGMLSVAGQHAPGVEWRQGVAESLPFPADSFDAVVSQFGLMFFEDRVKGIREMIRVLAPGGHLAVAVWESLENSAAYPVAVDLLERLAGAPAANALRAPFVLGDKAELAELFEEAGLGSTRIETHVGTARFPSVSVMVEADLRGWLPVMGVVLSEEQIQEILEEAEDALAAYVTDRGDVEFDSPAHIVSGTKS